MHQLPKPAPADLCNQHVATSEADLVCALPIPWCTCAEAWLAFQWHGAVDWDKRAASSTLTVELAAASTVAPAVSGMNTDTNTQHNLFETTASASHTQAVGSWCVLWWMPPPLTASRARLACLAVTSCLGLWVCRRPVRTLMTCCTSAPNEAGQPPVAVACLNRVTFENSWHIEVPISADSCGNVGSLCELQRALSANCVSGAAVRAEH